MKLKQSISFFDGENTEDSRIMMAMAVMLDYINNPKAENYVWSHKIPTTNDPKILNQRWPSTGEIANEDIYLGTALWDYLVDCLGGKPDWANSGWKIPREETRWMPLDQFRALIQLWGWACQWLEDHISKSDAELWDAACGDHPLIDAQSFKAQYDDEGHGLLWQSHSSAFTKLREAHELMKEVAVSSKDPQLVGAS